MEKIGLQLYSIKELTEKDFLGTLKKVAEAGYAGVEFAGFFNTPAKELRKVLDSLNLKAAGSHVGPDALKANLGELIEYALEIGNPYLICPWMPEEMCNSGDAYKRTADLFNQIGQKCKDNGLKFGYHNHEFEFKKFDGEYGLDLLVANTQPDLFFIELDTFWVEYSGLKSVDFINKYKERCSILHIKEMKSLEEKVSTTVGKGVMDFKGITAAGKQHGVEWYTVEQEEFESDQLESVRQGYEYLKAIL